MTDKSSQTRFFLALQDQTPFVLETMSYLTA
jgi:hypothetical protein